MTPPNYATAKRKVQVYIQSPASKVDNFCILLPLSPGAIIDKIIHSSSFHGMGAATSNKKMIFTKRSVFRSGQKQRREEDKI